MVSESLNCPLPVSTNRLLRPFSSARTLEVGQQLGNVLHLIEDGAFVELCQKTPGVGFGKVPLVRRSQVGIFQVGKSGSAEGSLARLPGPSHSYGAIRLKKRSQTAGDFTLNHGHLCSGRLCKVQVAHSIRTLRLTDSDLHAPRRSPTNHVTPCAMVPFRACRVGLAPIESWLP